MEDKRDWGEDPEFYGPFHLFRERKVIKVIKRNLKKGKVLDIGFGTGSLLFSMANIGLNIDGIEPAEGFVNYVKDKINTCKLNNLIKVRKGSATKLDYPSKQFDAVICTEVLEHVKHDKKAVKEFSRVLKRRGICIISVPIYKKNWNFSDEYCSHFRRYEPEEIFNMFRKQGFEIIEHKKICFGLMRLYHFKFKIPFIKRKEKKKMIFSKMSKIKLGILKYLYLILSKIFLLDDLFINKYPLGIIFVARKK